MCALSNQAHILNVLVVHDIFSDKPDAIKS